jgi:ADP-heptose:LPS heptosyltransferase
MKILVVRFSSIGDIVLTSPVVRCVKMQLPDAEIHYLTKKSYVGLVSNNPHISKVWTFDKDGRLSDLISKLQRERFDYYFDLHNNLRSRRVSFSLKAFPKRFNKLNIRKWILVNLGKDYLPKKHIVDRYMDVASLLDVKNDDAGLDYFFSPDSRLTIEMPSEYVCYAIGGQHATKKMPINKMIELCERVPKSVIVIGGQEDKEIGEELINHSPNVINLCGQLTIDQSALVMQNADCVISHDTGMMHIASALGKKVVSIWGNTVPSFGMYPYKADPQSVMFEVPNLSCRPCSKIGFDVCPKGHFNCMNLQNTEDISGVVNGE